MSIDTDTQVDRSIRRQLFWGGGLFALLVGGIGTWSALASISGAVIAPGTVVVQSNKKRVQHAEGGIVREINVQEGALVKGGDVLFRLDGTKVKAELDIVRNRMLEALVKRKRLIAERDGGTAFVVTPEIAELARGPTQLDSVVSVQRSLIATRKEMRVNQKAQLGERISQYREEIAGLEKQRAAKTMESEILQREIADLAGLHEKGLSPVSRLNALRRAKSDVDYELGQIMARIGQARGKISEAKLKILETDERYRNDTLTQLEEIEGKLLDLAEQRLALEDRLNRLAIVAPRSGQVHELKIHTVSAVVSSGEVLAYVVPDADDLVVEARVRLIDVDNVQVGGPANVRFTAFNLRTTPNIAGRVVSLSPDQILDERSGEAHFKARVALDKAERTKLGDNVIVAGMPVEVLITTSKRTIIDYLVKPLGDQINRAFRED